MIKLPVFEFQNVAGREAKRRLMDEPLKICLENTNEALIHWVKRREGRWNTTTMVAEIAEHAKLWS